MASGKATQEFIPIKEVRDGIVVLDDGSLRGIIMASSMNFALKSDDERQGILLQFQNFLNSLDFTVQVFIQSRRLDIKPYLATLEERKKTEVNDLMKVQIREYIEFVRKFTESTNIMTKNFFVVVPYSAAFLSSKKSGKKGIFKKKEKVAQSQRDVEVFEETRSQLEQRMAIVEQGLIRTGIKVAHLDNDSVIELFYRIFNPGETEGMIQIQE